MSRAISTPAAPHFQATTVQYRVTYIFFTFKKRLTLNNASTLKIIQAFSANCMYGDDD
ncbi:hypothetical protein SETIT_7G286300v2 [Setaria italica]|uniref:Uncharacterized protein n=1 Tax=Setaria italica TaxID=4555 RepID=A0A368S0Q6_SETIT|nr:hypothetical protein SETIT_7G286300v2 [Setaria italica]